MVRILILTAGTHGDVVPFLGLGQRLAAAGHEITVGATARFEPAVIAAGLGFHELPISDPREVAASEEGRAGTRAGMKGMLAATRTAAELMRRPLPAMIEAAAYADVVLATTATSLLATPIAEARGVPCLVLTLQPTEPTRTHGPVLLGGRNLGPWLNVAVPRRFIRLGMKMFAGLIRDVRGELGLAAEPSAGYRPEELTVLHGISPTVYPRPADWRPGVDVVGYWWPPTVAEDWTPDPALAEFLERGPAPIYVGFGSMGVTRTEQLSEVVREAVRLTGRRAIVSRGWADLAVEGPEILAVDDVPHGWLFPRVAAVVHHAGAGTTAAGLRAGVPVVPVPFAYDQPFWGRRLRELGVASEVIPAKRLTAVRLAAAIDAAPDRRPAAAGLAQRIAAEDGAARVLELIETGALA
jgi:UDP:flavonoid glycosyltransferase YjiC (YdhE family)